MLYNFSGSDYMKVNGTLEKKNIESKKGNMLTNTLILGLIGLVLLLIPDTLNKILGVIVGFILLLLGIMNVYQYLKSMQKYNAILISGILYSLLGMIILLSPSSVIRAVAIGLGILFLINGIMKIKSGITLRKFNEKWIGTLIIGIVVVILGILLIFNPFSGIAITKLAGAFLVLGAIFSIIDEYCLRK